MMKYFTLLLCLGIGATYGLPANLESPSKTDLKELLTEDGLNHAKIKEWQGAAREKGVGKGDITTTALLGENAKKLKGMQDQIPRVSGQLQDLEAQIAKATEAEKQALQAKKKPLVMQLNMFIAAVEELKKTDTELRAKVKTIFKKAGRSLSENDLTHYQENYAK